MAIKKNENFAEMMSSFQCTSMKSPADSRQKFLDYREKNAKSSAVNLTLSENSLATLERIVRENQNEIQETKNNSTPSSGYIE